MACKTWFIQRNFILEIATKAIVASVVSVMIVNYIFINATAYVS